MKKVLIVEDDIQARAAMESFLNSKKIPSISCTTWGEAMKLLIEEQSIGGVLLDYHLPDMQGLRGLEDCNKIRADVRIIYISGGVTPHQVAKAMKTGAWDFFGKPIASDEFDDFHKAIYALIECAQCYRKIFQ